MKKYIVLTLLMFSLTAFAETTVFFEPDTVNLGDSAELVFRSTTPIQNVPDLSFLQKSLAVSGQSQRTYAENINGRRKSVYEIRLNVFPRQEGEISTGVLRFNGSELEPAILNVGGETATDKLPVFFESSVNTYDAYPQEIILYSIKLTDEVGLLTAQISTPEIEGARVILLDMDKSYQDYRDNRVVRIFERTFAVIPEKAGYLSLPPVELYGSVASKEQDYMGDLFAQGMLFNGFAPAQKNIRLETPSVQIKVLEKPTDWQGWWLPSEQVVLTADDNAPDTVSVGDSITRNIRLSALNTVAETLPPLKQRAGEGLKIYPSPEQRETIQSPTGDLQGILTTSVVFVPTQGGELKIPALEVPWFNTKTGKTEKAVIPEKIIQVQGTAQVQPPVQNKQEIRPIQKTIQNVSSPQPNQPSTEKERKTIPVYWIIGFAFGGILFGGIIGYVFSHHRHKRKKSYHLQDKSPQKKEKNKKAIPDLYPF